MAQVALIGHSRPKTQRVKDRISKRISDHALANTWWDPNSLPSWLTEEYYIQKIQPLLRGKKVREIAEAMQVSQAYAAFVLFGPTPPASEALAGVSGIDWYSRRPSMTLNPNLPVAPKRSKWRPITETTDYAPREQHHVARNRTESQNQLAPELTPR